MKKKYNATVHTLAPNKAPVEFIFDVWENNSDVILYYLNYTLVATVPKTYLVTHTEYKEPATEGDSSAHKMD